MARGTTFDVEVRYFSSGDPGAALSKIGGNAKKKGNDFFKDFASGASGAFGAFNSAFDSVAATVATSAAGMIAATAGAAALGLAKATQIGVQFNSEIEQATIGLGAIFAANGTSQGMIGGMMKSREIMGDMRKDARELPGEFKDLVNIMSTIATPGGHAGKTAEEIEKLAAQTMSSAAVLHVPQATAAREMAMLLEGNAKHSQPLAMRLDLGDLKAFNQLSPEKRFDKIKESLDKLNPAIAYFAHSWEGIKTTAVDALRGGLGAITKPVMDVAKGRLYDFLNPQDNDKTRRRTESFQNFGQKASEDLVAGFYNAEHFLKRWVPIANTFVHTLYDGFDKSFGRLEPMFEFIGEKLEGFMKDPKAFDKLADVAKLMVATRVGTGVMQGGFSLAGMMGGGGAGGAGGLAALAAAAPEIAIAAVAVGALGIAAFGAVQALEDSKSYFHDDAVSATIGIGVAAESMTTSWGKLTKAAEPLTEAMGAAFLNIIEGTVTIGAAILEFAADLATAARSIVGTMFGLIDGSAWGAKPGKDNHVYKDNPERVFVNPYGDESRFKPPVPPNHTTHIHKVEIRVEGNEDPDRVARIVVQKLGDLSRNPKTSPQDPRSPILAGRSF